MSLKVRDIAVQGCRPQSERGLLVSNATIAALIAAASGLTGGLLAAMVTRWAEQYRFGQALLEKAEERRLSSIEAFMLAATAWLDWLKYIEELGWKDIPDKGIELNRRDKARDEAYRRLLLLASGQLHRWLLEVYKPAELKVRRTYAYQLRMVGQLDDAGRAARDTYDQLLSKEFVDLARIEVKYCVIQRSCMSVEELHTLASVGRLLGV